MVHALRIIIESQIAIWDPSNDCDEGLQTDKLPGSINSMIILVA
jgi:hypothetical protein